MAKTIHVMMEDVREAIAIFYGVAILFVATAWLILKPVAVVFSLPVVLPYMWVVSAQKRSRD